MKPRAVVLDFDGVIIESNDIKTRAFELVFDRYPEVKKRMLDYHHANVSLSRFDKFRFLVFELLGRYGDEELVNELAEEYSRLTVDELCACPYVYGAAEFLDEFAAVMPLFLASVTPEVDLLNVIRRRGIDRFFRKVYGCPPWTKAGAVREILREDILSPEEVVLVGDSPGDRAAAVSTGVAFVARNSGIAFDPSVTPIFRDMIEVGAELRRRIFCGQE